MSEDFDVALWMFSHVYGVPRNRRISIPRLPCFVSGLTGCTDCGLPADEATGSFHSTLGSPAMSLSIMDHAAILHLLSEPLIPLPDAVFLHADPTLLLDLTQSYNDLNSDAGAGCLSESAGSVDASNGPSLDKKVDGRLSNHPLISAVLTRCPYRMTTYREADLASVDTSFGVQIHHPRFLECVGAPELARLLGRPTAEWLNIMDRRDALRAALQLQRDAGLMSSNLTV